MNMLKGRIKRVYKNHTKNLPENGTNTDSFNKTTKTSATDIVNERNKGGRIIGTMYEAIEHIKHCENEARLEITDEYSKLLEKSKTKGEKQLASGIYLKLHKVIKKDVAYLIRFLKEDMLVRTGVDVSCQQFDETHLNNHDDFNYFLNNLGNGQQYPGGPVCMFEDKEVPCMVEFLSGGRMSGAILTKKFATLDALKLFDEA
jgi:hypothetical protein